MTATTEEEDQADDTGSCSHEDYLADSAQYYLVDAFAAMTVADELLRAAIAAELAMRVPHLEREQVKAAKAKHETWVALQEPERAIADHDVKIAAAESERATWQEQLEQGDVAARVEARRWVAEWDSELATLRQAKEFAEAQLLPYQDAHAKACAAFDDATSKLAGWKLNATPECAYVGAGRETRAYAFRFGRELRRVLSNPDDREHDVACAELRELCIAAMRAGYDITADLPDFTAIAFRAMTAEMADAATTPPDPVPSMTDVMALTKADFENSALQAASARNVADDRRGARPVPAPPQRSYMDVPRVRDLGIGR